MMNKALRLVRVYHDLNQGDAAERVGLSKSYISELENGRKKVTLEVLEKYSKAFDIPVSSLMLFGERAGEIRFSEDVRIFVAEKVITMLDWIATISDNKKDKQHG